jgi:hypothetical protein
MNRSGRERRRFLVAAITFSSAAVLAPEILLHGKAWAESGSRKALLRITRLLYPHDALPASVYSDVLDQSLAAVAGDDSLGKLLESAERALDRGAAESFIDAPAEAQISALKAVENEPYFGAVLFAVSSKLYTHPETWKMLGYGGPSFEMGGYIDRGSGDIDWLPGAES